MLRRSRLHEDARANRLKKRPRQDEPEGSSGGSQPPRDLPFIWSRIFLGEVSGTRRVLS